MQANLKSYNHKFQYTVFSASNMESSMGGQQNGGGKQSNQLQNSNITNSRMTNTNRIITNQHLAQDNQIDEQTLRECPTCCVWKRWAVQQQIKLLKLQENIIDKQNVLQKVIQQLNISLQEKQKSIHLYNENLANCHKEIATLNQIIKKHQRQQLQAKEMGHNPAISYNTPLKNNNTHNRAGTSIKTSQITDDKKGSTAATKPQLEWSAFQTNLQKFKQNKQEDIGKYVFENKMLKDYNTVLLQRLKESKYRKPF